MSLTRRDTDRPRVRVTVGAAADPESDCAEGIMIADQEIPGPPCSPRDPDSRSRPNRKRRFPVSPPGRFPIPANRESGSPRFPKKRGNRGNWESDFLSGYYSD
jgi:hypothetical protein